MSNSYRIRTQVGVDKSIKLLLDQDFEHLEILSLKIMQSQIYTRQCSDYGVIIGRVTSNGGFGIPNAKVSVFIPLSKEDENNPMITDIYPYKDVSDVNEDGYRYNLLPYRQSYSEHTPTGTFFTREDVLVEPSLIQVFDKYYKYTVKTNDSGDYMIFGVPVGSQKIHVDIDLSDIGEFSLSPQDLIRMGVATESQIAGTKFKSSQNLAELPQIISFDRPIEVEPLWGQPEICNIAITRTDFDLTESANINITPTAIFMGSIVSSNEDANQKGNCKPSLKQGKLCNLVAGPGEILAIRQTIQQDINGRPVLETVDLESGGQVIDENGTWLVDVPMNMDYVVTNEFGEKVISNDPKIGIPTKGKYRFKVKWNQSPSLREPIKRGYFLLPNIREYGWPNSNSDPLKTGTLQQYQEAIKSYSFSLDWDDYADIETAIKCEDTFYEMTYNKVYTVSQLISQYRNGSLPNRIIAIKDILSEECESENVKFPTNDAVFRMDIIYLLFTFVMYVFRPILYILLIVSHVLAFLLKYILGPILAIIVGAVMVVVALLCSFVNSIVRAINKIPKVNMNTLDCPSIDDIKQLVKDMLNLYKKFTHLNLPNITYPDCDICSCKEGDAVEDKPEESDSGKDSLSIVQDSGINSILSPYTISSEYTTPKGFTTRIDTFPETYVTLLTGRSGGYKDTAALAPQVTKYGEEDNGISRLIYTSSLPIAERINLFNTKAKYFDTDPTNPYGGVNQIEVSFQTTSSDKHTDNIILLSCEPSQLPFFKAGKLVSFQDLAMSKDINLTGSTVNDYGTKSITGSVIKDGNTLGPFLPGTTNEYYSRNITIKYVKPDNTNGTAQYTITGKTKDFTYHKFPMDVEYFQVVTAMTINTFTGLKNNTNMNRIPNGLWDRFLGNTMKYGYFGDIKQNYEIANPHGAFNTFSNFGKQVLVFLVRGVDPNSPRVDSSYDLSKLFGDNAFGRVKVTGKYKLNIPIQKETSISGFKAVKHDITNSYDIDIYSGIKLYYDSFFFQPTTVGSNKFSGFTSDLPKYYSSLDSTNTTFRPNKPDIFSTQAPQVSNAFNTINGLNIGQNSNGFRTEPVNEDYWPSSGYALPNRPIGVYLDGNCDGIWDYQYSYSGIKKIENLTSNDNRGYYKLESVEGGSAMYQDSNILLPIWITDCNNPRWYYYNIFSTDNVSSSFKIDGTYYAPSYASNTNYSLNYTLGANDRQMVMRSDRLPTSTTLKIIENNYYALQSNLDLTAFIVGDDGSATAGQGTSVGGNPTGAFNEAPDSNPGQISALYDTFTCSGLIPLECYTYDNNSKLFVKKPDTDECYGNKVNNDGEKILVNGCYILITNIFKSLGRDLLLMGEWATRTQISFGACRNVWSHLFTNNWINGALYAFTFKNDRFFDKQNRPYSSYCKDTVVLHPTTNNFYYRSSPYNNSTGEFIGKKKTTSYKGNSYYLSFPTTIMDLGPRNNYLQEIIMSDDYDGYVVDKLAPTTYGDVSEMLNLLILSRLVNSKVMELLLGAGNAGILTYFNSRNSNLVDGDYSQLLSIQSEFGVNPFEVSSYPDAPAGQQSPIFFNGYSKDVVMGIFFSSDTQSRDFITPKRTILNGDLDISYIDCSFSYFNVSTQKVPFYQWELKTNTDGSDSIFGSQTNDWYTSPILGTGFLSEPYQKIDRLNDTYRYFKTNTTTITKYFKGYIYSVENSNGNLNSNSGSIKSYNPPRVITVGAPQHFYFGLKKGKTSLDRFIRKWINTETVVD